MKKDRNNFFSQGSYGYYTQPIPTSYPLMQEIGYQNQDIDSRLTRLEKEINRLDSRIAKLESTKDIVSQTSTDYSFANSMYMI